MRVEKGHFVSDIPCSYISGIEMIYFYPFRNGQLQFAQKHCGNEGANVEERQRGDPHFCSTLESLLKNYDSFQIVLTKSNAAFKLFVVSKKFER